MTKATVNEEVARLWTEHLPSVAAYVRSMAGNFHDAQDVLQEVSMAVVRKYEQYDPNRSFAAWSIGIARNEILAHRRRASVSRTVFDGDAFESITEAFIANADPDEVNPILEALERCVAAAPEKSRDLLRMRYLDDLPYERMATRLNVSVSAIKVAMHRLRTALRDCIERRLGPRGAAS